MASPYEECRAECAGLYLCLESEVLRVFGHEEVPAEGVHDIVYINWLLMVHAGVKGLEISLQKHRHGGRRICRLAT